MEIKIKYHFNNMEKIKKIEQGDWIDLRSAEQVTLNPFEFYLISLGISIELPKGYEAHIVPRSSTFKNFGIIQVNGIGIIDENYNGNNDIWKMGVLAIRNTTIMENDRICQFRIMEKQPSDIKFKEVDFLNNIDRGGFGSTGKN